MSDTEAEYANMQNSTNQSVKVVAGVGGGILLPAIIVAFVRLLSGVKLAALQVGYISFDFLMAATILAIAMAADIECDQFKADLIRASIILHFIFFFASNGCSIWKMSCKCSDWCCPNGRPCQCGCLLAIFDRKRQVELAHLLLWLVATVVLAYYLLVLLIASGFLDIDRINYYTDPQYCIILRVSFETFRCPSRSKPFFSNTLCLYLIATMQFGKIALCGLHH